MSEFKCLTSCFGSAVISAMRNLRLGQPCNRRSLRSARPMHPVRVVAVRHAPTGLELARAQARECRNCPLWQRATQTVFGEGDPHARLVLVGEQPGDAE